MRLNVCLSCRFPLTPHSLMTITALRWWQYSLYSAQYTHWGSESKNSHRSIPLSLSHLTRQSSPSIIWLGNATRTQNTSTPKCFIIVMLSSWGRYNNSFFDVDFSRFLLFWRSDDRTSFPLFFYSSRRIKVRHFNPYWPSSPGINSPTWIRQYSRHELTVWVILEWICFQNSAHTNNAHARS